MKTVRTRFAPSPTGYIHIGNVRSAIYPYLLAHQKGGKFVLRIEDTDRARYVEGATELIEDTLKWLGLDWDEGPEVGGPYAPYFQTERREHYLEWAHRLIAQGRAYYDHTSPEQIQTYRDAATRNKQAFLYRNYRPADAGADGSDNQDLEQDPHCPIRFLSDPKPRSWHDAVMGDLSAGPETQDDIVLIKQDGLPTYNFAHIIDDAEMKITHIMRGVEYLSSTPNYLAIYEALGIEPPVFVSLPHILAPTGNKKLGKRDGAKSATDYRADGILPEALLNYLACLGWNDGSEQEIYTKSELIAKFSLDKIQSSGARYDETKLLWTNGQWIRKIATGQKDIPGSDTDLDAEPTAEGIAELYRRSANFWPASAAAYDDEYKKQVLAIIYDRLKTLGDLRSFTTYFFEDPAVALDLITSNKFLKKLSEAELSTLIQQTLDCVNDITIENWNVNYIQGSLNRLLEQTGKKPAELFSLIRLALSFAPFSPALNLTICVLGKDTVLSRLAKVKQALERN